MELLRNALKERLAAGELALCLRSTLAVGPDTGVIARAGGFDAFYVDLEHAPVDPARAAAACLAAAPLGVTGLARVARATAERCVPLLDAGCQGIIAAHVDTAADARAVVDACRYAPTGRRSVSGAMPHLGYATPTPGDPAAIDRATLVGVMLETGDAVDAVAEIAAVDGVDLLFVGSVDLRADRGIAAEADPWMRDAYARVGAACREAGVAFGVGGVADAAVLADAVDAGARFLSAGHDQALLLEGAWARTRPLRALAP